MSLMKIIDYETGANTFTWTYNPQVYEVTLDANLEVTNVAFSKTHIIVSGGGISPKMYILSGHTSGTNRFTDFRNIAKATGDNTVLKKLYFESDKFAIVLGKQIKQVNTGERTMFVDYVASFISPLPLLFDDTQKTSGTNGGTAPTYVEEITGVSDGSTAVITDGTNSFSISGLTNNDAVVMKIISMKSAGGGVYITKYRSVTVNGVEWNKQKTISGTGYITLVAGANITGVTATHLTSLVKKFRDAYYM